MSKYIGISRNAMLIKDNINYNRRHDLEHPVICTIWIQVNTIRNKSIMFMGRYRQWTLLKQLINIINNPNHQIYINQIKLASLDNPQQYKELNNPQFRQYQIILQQWTNALTQKINTIVLMDDNIDTSLNASHNKNIK